jgi:hypothetical protein
MDVVRSNPRLAGGAVGGAALAVLLFFLDKAIDTLPAWLLYPGLVICALIVVICAVVVVRSFLRGRVSFQRPVVVRKPTAKGMALEAESSSSPSPARDPYERGTALQREWHGKQLRVGFARVAGELECAERVLGNRNAEYFFAESNLPRIAWEAYGDRFVDADLMALHKRIRGAYQAMEVLEQQGVRRGLVTSQGRKTSIVDYELLVQAQDAVRAAIAALDEAQSSTYAA